MCALFSLEMLPAGAVKGLSKVPLNTMRGNSAVCNCAVAMSSWSLKTQKTQTRFEAATARLSPLVHLSSRWYLCAQKSP